MNKNVTPATSFERLVILVGIVLSQCFEKSPDGQTVRASGDL